MPTTVSPGQSRRRSRSRCPAVHAASARCVPEGSPVLDGTQQLLAPTCTRSAGEEMRDTDKQSMGSSAAMPQPISQNAPKILDVRHPKVQGMTLTSKVSRYCRRHSRWASERESETPPSPFSSTSVPVMTKQVRAALEQHGLISADLLLRADIHIPQKGM